MQWIQTWLPASVTASEAPKSIWYLVHTQCPILSFLWNSGVLAFIVWSPFSVSFQGKTKRDPHIWSVITWDHYLSQGQRQQQWQPICPPGCPQSSTTAPSSPPWWWLGWSFKYIFNNNNLGNLLLTSAMEMLTGTLVVNWSSPDPPSMAITCKESKSQTSNYAKKIPPKSRR